MFLIPLIILTVTIEKNVDIYSQIYFLSEWLHINFKK